MTSAAEKSGFFAACNVLIVAGKGGVGKTTVGASLGIAAARAGSDVLLIELEGHSTLGPLLGGLELGYDDVEVELTPPVSGRLRARRIQPDNALTDYLDRAGLGPISNRLIKTGAMEVVVTAAPGIRDLLTLGKIRQLEQAGDAELIIVDAPAAGHALTFLTAAAGLADATSSGPIREQADLVLEMFADDSRCQVVLVTLPEETPVTETIETAFSLEDEVGLKLAPVVVNGLWPEIEGLADTVKPATRTVKPATRTGTVKPATATVESATATKTGSKNRPGSPDDRDVAVEAARYRLARIEDQRAEVERLAGELPLDQIHLPLLFRTELNRTEVEDLAEAVAAGVERLRTATNPADSRS